MEQFGVMRVAVLADHMSEVLPKTSNTLMYKAASGRQLQQRHLVEG